MSQIMKGGEPIFINKNSDVGILMIHGFTSTPDEFREMSVYFSEKGFTVYAPLITGHGTLPANLLKTTPKDWVESIKVAYLKLKEKSSKILIVGNSFGSNLGFWLIKEFNNEPIGIVTLDAPIFMKHHFLAMLRLNTYGLFKKYYRKSPRVYETDYIDGVDQITYPVIPIKSLREFLKFIKIETVPNLDKVTVPVFIAHSKTDPVIHPRSATYIFDHVGSKNKKIYWFFSDYHGFTVDGRKTDIFQKVFDFVQEITSSHLNV